MKHILHSIETPFAPYMLFQGRVFGRAVEQSQYIISQKKLYLYIICLRTTTTSEQQRKLGFVHVCRD